MGVARKIYNFLNKYALLNILSDELHTKLKYRLKMGRSLNLNNPQTFTEKLSWLKLYDHDPRYLALVDKWDVMEHVANTIGSNYCVKKYGVWDSFDEIDFDALPDQFVLKSTNDSGSTVICKDKSTFDKAAAREKLNCSKKRSYYWYNREWQYKHLKHRILAEEYLTDASGDGLIDYKFFCFDGKPEFMFIATGRATGNTRFDFFDMDFQWIPVKQHYPNADVRPSKPAHFEEMKELAQKLSQGLKHVRVDFFLANDQVYFGELTFVHFGGYERFEPSQYDYEFGKLLTLPELHNKRK